MRTVVCLLALIVPSAAEELDPAITKALEFEITAAFVSTPLATAITFLQEQAGATIVLDPRVSDEQVTLEVEAVPLARALDAMLEPLGYGWVPSDGAIFISTMYRIRARQVVTRFYDCRDLLSPVEDHPRRPLGLDAYAAADEAVGATFAAEESYDLLDADMLAEVIVTQVAPEIWDEGSCSMTMLSGLMAVAAPPGIHDQIQAFLGELRAHRGAVLALDVRAVAVRRDALAGSLGGAAGLAGGMVVLDDAARAALASAGSSLGELFLLGFDAQSVAGMSGFVRATVTDQDVVIAQSSVIFDPLVGRDVGGIAGSLRPVILPGDERVSVDVSVEMVEVRESRALVATAGGAVGVPGGDGPGTRSQVVLGSGEKVELGTFIEEHFVSRLEIPLGQTIAVARTSPLVESDEVLILTLGVRRVR